MANNKVFASMDGNQAAAHCAYAFTEVAGIYPITPSTPMPEYVDLWASQGKKNLFGMPVKVIEMQSEAGAAGTVHGSLLTGALTTTFTASQGLLLKIPNMYKIAGELLPGVIHVSARSIAVQALSIFGDHQDVMAARQTGFAMLASGSVQETMDIAGVAHLAAIKTSVPFLHFFDGFRTSHEVNKVEVMDYEVFDRLLDKEKVKEFRKRALNSMNPTVHGTAQNDDVYMQAREIQEKYYKDIPNVVADYLNEISKVTGRSYAPFSYYGDKEATDVIIAIGSVTETIREVIDALTKQGKKVGLISVHLYRPFSAEYLFKAMPQTVKRIAVLDRTKENGSVGEPLYLDVKGVYYGKENAPIIIGGRYGLSSKDTTPNQILAVYKNLNGEQKDRFTIGINDDVNYSSLDDSEDIDVSDPTTTELLFFGLGSDGTVGACKDTIKIIGENTNLYAQAYSSYDSKKSGGVTRMHLRFGANPIRSTYLVSKPHFVSCSQDSYLRKYDLIGGIRENGTFLLNTSYSKEEIVNYLPNNVKRILAKRNVKFYIIDANKLAAEVGLGNRINTIMESAFFKLNEQILEYEKAQTIMKKYAAKTYGRKGEAVVKLNYDAIDIGASGLISVAVDKEWANLPIETKQKEGKRPHFVETLAEPVDAIKGYDLPVSAFEGFEDGLMPTGTAAFEKRGVAPYVSEWIPENCIQCNQCSFVCPHACIRPFLADEEEVKNAPEGTKMLKANGKGLEGLQFRIQISPLDCTGCGVCVNICPSKEKALKLTPMHEVLETNEGERAEYFYKHVTYKDYLLPKNNAKNSQFAQPLFEFSGACAGCGETPYIKLVTQLFGERMVIANATGCTSIYGASFPSSPYTKNKEGRGPAWANSLFEDNAEFGFGMKIASETLRDHVQNIMVENMDNVSEEVKGLFQEWIDNRQDGEKTLQIAKKLMPILESCGENCKVKELLQYKQYLVKQSNWIFGGDGWAYDIGYGGLDHVIANEEDVNILVLDTEVYSNTGGQSSKSARTGSIAKFTASGKPNKKKDLANIAMSYGHVYVASVCHGANQQQLVKALKEAESYPGPSLIIAYSPCIAHGIQGGLGNSQLESKLATECGYWPIFRYDPRLEAEGKNPFQLDSKEPNWNLYHDFLLRETRYNQLSKINPEKAQELLDENLKEAQRRYKVYQRYMAMDFSK